MILHSTLLLFNIGGAELFFIVLVVIMFFGSKKIPELARGLGKGMKELKNATNDIQQEIKDSTKDITKIKDSVDVEKQVKDLLKDSDNKSSDESNPIKEEEKQPSQPNTISRTSPYSGNQQKQENNQ